MPKKSKQATKHCTGCHTDKALDEFCADKSSKDGLFRLCRPCDNAAQAKSRARVAARKAAALAEQANESPKDKKNRLARERRAARQAAK